MKVRILPNGIAATYQQMYAWMLRHESFHLGMLAVVIGVLAGYGALAVRMGIEAISEWWVHAPTWSAAIHLTPWYIYILAPVCGGLMVGLINKYILPANEAKVIPGVIESLSERGGYLSPRKSIGELASNMISVGSGASMGREAPTVALGAALASHVSSLLELDEKQMRTMVGCGVAAGIASSFNAPIAGVMFALEVILVDYAVTTFTPIVLASVIGTVISRSYFGNMPAFTIPDFRLVSSWEVLIYVVLGVFCGLISAAIIRAMPIARRQFALYVPNPLLRPATAGLILGFCALFIPEIMSIGYGTLDAVLTEQPNVHLWGLSTPLVLFLAVLFLAKAVTSTVCMAGGFGGGMIGPSLFIGVTAGGFFGIIVHALFPAITETYGAYALVASGAMMAAMLQAPISSILMVFELSGNYEIMMPLMAACVIAALTKRAFGAQSVLTEPLEEKGLEPNWGLERSWMRAVPISRIPRRKIPAVAANASLALLKKAYVDSGKGCVQVIDAKGRMLGIVTFVDLQHWLLDATLDQIVVAAEVANRHVISVSEDDSLLDAIRILDRESFEQMPVMSATKEGEMLGILSRNAVFSTYHKLIVKHGE
ncbi:MAG: chloride channel protein [Mariprofundaceae bacterium]|nr:chloride channel protein [Mariprofundaceae bacterium]